MGGYITGVSGPDFLAEYQARGHPGASFAAMLDDMMGGSLPGVYSINGAADVAVLPAAAEAYLGKKAILVDLFEEKRDTVVCCKVGSLYFWQPERPIYDKSRVITGNVTVEPLLAGSVMNLSGTIGVGVTRTVTLGTAWSWPGAQADIRFPGVILGSLNILGSGLGSGVALLGGGYKKFSCEIISGALAWKQLV